MKLDIQIDKPDWDESGKREYLCVIVKFPNCSFKWMPTYDELDKIRNALNVAELLNLENKKERDGKEEERL